MKTSIIVVIMVLSQSLMAKISDFNTMIQEESVAQKETYRSLKEKNFKPIETADSASIDETDVIILGAVQEDISKIKAKKTASSLSKKNVRIQHPDRIEEKQFIRLGEELDEAQ